MKSLKAFVAVGLVFGMGSMVEAQSPAKHPCEQIENACKAAGFVYGQAKQGSGLWKDCIDPIMQGESQPANADKKLPAVDPSVVAACKTKKPKWGEGK